MKLIVFSDVHGNQGTLMKLLEREQPTPQDIYIYCGDLLGYYYAEESVIELLQKIPTLYAVQGNHDAYYANSGSYQSKQELAQKYGASYTTSKADVIAYINTLPTYVELELGGKNIYICHGSIEDALEGRIYPDSDLVETAYDYIFNGHSHYQMQRSVGRTTYINPGSLGQPRDGKGFSYCVITLQEGMNDVVEFKTVDPAIESLQEECLKREGKVTYASTVLEREKRM